MTVENFEPIKLEKPNTHLMQSRITKGCEGVKPLSKYVEELHELIRQEDWEAVKAKVDDF